MSPRIAGFLVALCLGGASAFARADRSLDEVHQAQALLGADTWSLVLRIENTDRRGPYPHLVYSLVFELADLLWFYTPTDGTQSLSLHRGQLAQEKADLRPLLLAIDRGFHDWQVLPSIPAPRGSLTRRLPNGCFIESVAAWRRLASEDETAQAAMLLSFYPRGPDGTPGHTVLAIRTARGIKVFDPARPHAEPMFSLRLADHPLDLARQFAGDTIAKARIIPLSMPPRQVAPIDQSNRVAVRRHSPADQLSSRSVERSRS